MTIATGRPGRGEVTRERILDAAETLFANLSFAAARLEDVAQAVGIRRASIVYYFRNKQELYEAMEGRLFEALEEECRRRLAGCHSALERIEALADAWLHFMVARPSAARLILRNCADVYPGGPDPVQFSRSALDSWDEAVRAGVAAGEFAEVSPVQLMQLCGGGILLFASSGQLLGPVRNYEPTEDATFSAFRTNLHRALRALLRPVD